jgi:hypothetical protein
MIQIASKLLTALKEALHNDVSSTVWSDIDKLRKLVDAKRDFCEGELHWRQRYCMKRC